ncbi:MAG: cytochrome c oxidase subunit 3 [Fimbriimonadaceae bacterium]|nr:cytochrome c oxidase subunit 3 [Fimbriimonadaceae bacterium]
MSSHESTHPDAPVVYEQFEDIGQQQETYVLGMWSFLVNETMFFAPLFFVYGLYTWKHHADFYLAHALLDWRIGGINTFILLMSSFAVALSVHYAQKGRTRAQLNCLWFTIACAAAFIWIKLQFEWIPKISHGVFPNPEFIQNYPHYAMEHGVPAADPYKARLYYSLYFAITGLHALHVAIGIIVFLALIYLIKKKSSLITDYIPTEMVGLYWHFVDLVWIFLYPLFYLMPRP